MANPKLIIVVGSDPCVSATDGPSWVEYLADYLQPEKVINLSECNLSNDIIGRRVIFSVMEFIKDYDRSDILVCVMWNRIDSIDSYKDELEKQILSNIDHYLKTDWFLKMIGVRYFFSNSSIYCRPHGYFLENNPEIKKYELLIDYYHWLDSNSIQMWTSLRGHKIDEKTKNTTTKGHKEFTHKVIISWLKERGYIKST